jgi:DNA-binding phage protein
MKRSGARDVLMSATFEKRGTDMKYIDKMLIASGVTLLLTGGVAAAALAPGSADAVIAQLPGDIAIFASNGPFGSPNILATAATYIGITATDLRTELQTGKTLAEVAVAHGKTRDGLIAALSAEATRHITTAVDQPGTNFSGPGGRGGPGGPGRPRAMITNDIAAAAAYIGTTEADLRTKQQAGQTLAQIATAAGKTRDGLIAAMVADGTAKVDAALTAGTITAAQATEKKASVTAHVTAEVDQTRPAGGGPGGRGPRR